SYGRMIFVSSVSGLLAHPHHAPYAATKGGLNQLLRVMAREWAASNVTVNAVAPGYIETDLTKDYLAKDGVRAGLTALVPAERHPGEGRRARRAHRSGAGRAARAAPGGRRRDHLPRLRPRSLRHRPDPLCRRWPRPRLA